MSERASGHICTNPCFVTGMKVGEMCALILDLHSYLQIKAKNYDKVEKVSVRLSHL